MTKTKVFSGARSSGRLHLGNYLGAIKNWIELQDAADQAIFGVMDLHGITTPYDPKTYQDQVLATAMDYLAAGVDPKKALLIRQSRIPQHTELTWLLNTITPVSWLNRLPTFKEKVGQLKQLTRQIKKVIKETGKVDLKLEIEKEYSRDELAKHKIDLDQLIDKQVSKALADMDATVTGNVGLLDYPVLMTADILIYKSNLVPVGDDQKAHIDVANEIVKKFNSHFGQTFEPVKGHQAQGARIMSLQDGTKKMSKTGDEAISLSDDPDTVIAKIKKAQTDSGKEIRFNPEEKPAISNLITIYSLLADEQIGEIETMYQGKSYADFKKDLAEVVVEFLKPFQARYQEFKNDPDQVLKILSSSEEQARVIAAQTLSDVKSRMGL